MYKLLRYLLYLTIIVGILSCNNNSNISYKEELCPECNGSGKIKASTGTKIFLGIITFGPGVMVETVQCDYCQGTGVIKIKDLK